LRGDVDQPAARLGAFSGYSPDITGFCPETLT